jgi:hypothetical protein
MGRALSCAYTGLSRSRVDPSNKSTDALQDLLLRRRAEGKVKFDINSGTWSKA